MRGKRGKASKKGVQLQGSKATTTWITVEDKEFFREVATKHNMALWGVIHLLAVELQKNENLVDFKKLAKGFPKADPKAQWQTVENQVHRALPVMEASFSVIALHEAILKQKEDDEPRISLAQVHRCLMNYVEQGDMAMKKGLFVKP